MTAGLARELTDAPTEQLQQAVTLMEADPHVDQLVQEQAIGILRGELARRTA